MSADQSGSNPTTATCWEYTHQPCPIPQHCGETNRCLVHELKIAGWRVLEPWTEMKPGEHRQIGPHTAAFRPSVDPQPWDERRRLEDEPGTVRWYFGKPVDGKSE
jgi:hypothetical protein